MKEKHFYLLLNTVLLALIVLNSYSSLDFSLTHSSLCFANLIIPYCIFNGYLFFLTPSATWLFKALSGHLLASVFLAELTSLVPEESASIWIETGLWCI